MAKDTGLFMWWEWMQRQRSYTLQVIFTYGFGGKVDQGRTLEIMELVACSQQHLLDRRHVVATLPCTRQCNYLRLQSCSCSMHHAVHTETMMFLPQPQLQHCLVIKRQA